MEETERDIQLPDAQSEETPAENQEAQGLLAEMAAQIPEAAGKIAEKEGISLLEAWLRLYQEEARPAKQAREEAALAAARSAGSLRDVPACPAVEEDAFAGAFRTALY